MSSAASPAGRILVVEDHDEMRASIRETLNGLPFEVLECADGERAVETFRHQQPEWVLMDIGLPSLDGLAATRAIHEASPTAKVIILTAFDSPAFRAAAARAGAVAFVLKSDLGRLPSMLSRAGGRLTAATG